MKKVLLPVVALLPLATFAQKPFTINGDIKGLKNGNKIYLVYPGGDKKITDSSIVTNGAFFFKGTLSEPAKASLFLNKKPNFDGYAEDEALDKRSFYLESTTIKITAPDSLKKAAITGSAINDDERKLNDLTKPVSDKLAAINAEYSKFTPEQRENKEVMEDLRARFKNVAKELTPIFLSYAKSNPKSYISLTKIFELAGRSEQVAEAEKAFLTLSPELRASKLGTDVAQLFNADKNTMVGVMAMDFTQNDVNNKPVKLSDFRGKYVLLDFWASWCIPCREENPNVVAAYNAYKDKNFTVLGVSVDDPVTKKMWLDAIKKDGLVWTQVSDLQGWNNAASKMYGVRSIPANYLIDPTGKIVAKDIRGEELQKKLAEFIK